MAPRVADSLCSFEPWIRPYVEYLISHERKISLTDEPLQIIESFQRLTRGDDLMKSKCDKFKLKIPYADQFLTWEILFDVTNMKEPPDIIFDAEDEDFHPPLENISSLVCWDWRKRKSLAEMISELLELYREYQLEKAGYSTALQRHISSLMTQSPDNFQIIVNRAERGLGTTNVLIQHRVDFSCLPPQLIQRNPGTSSAVLHVYIPYPESSSIQSQLYLPPAVENAFGGAGKLRIPVFQPGILLGEYFTNINELLKKQVQIISEGFMRKQDYVCAFLAHFGRSVLEYDAQTFSKVVLLLEWNDFLFTFTVELPLYFPTDHPTFTFKSVYHNHKQRPYSEKHTDFPYSPRWSGAEMASRAGAYVLDNIRGFQMSSVTNADK